MARIADNTISNNIAKRVFEAMWDWGGRGLVPTPPTPSSKQGLKQITDTGAIEALIDEVRCHQRGDGCGVQGRQREGLQRAGRPGNESDQGKANPQQVNELLLEKARLTGSRPAIGNRRAAMRRRVSGRTRTPLQLL